MMPVTETACRLYNEICSNTSLTQARGVFRVAASAMCLLEPTLEHGIKHDVGSPDGAPEAEGSMGNAQRSKYWHGAYVT